jgi:hypothetical protein
MSPGFWWNWYVQLAVAVGTVGAVIVAIYSIFRKRLPRLDFGLLRPKGERTRLTDTGEDVRYYHLRVWNENRFVPGDDAQVFITRIEDLHRKTIWLGNLPLRWRDQEFVPLFQKVGSEKHADLCRIGQQNGLTLLPLYEPNNFTVNYPGRCHLILWVQARSNQADSDPLKVEINWNGIWDDDDKTMLDHITITVGNRLRIFEPERPED